MRIAIDIDRTLLDCDSFLYKFVNDMFSNQNANRRLKYKNLVITGKHTEGVLKYISRICNHKHYTIMGNAGKIINKWYDNKYEIMLLSNRPGVKALDNTLINCINRFDIKFNKIITQCNNKVLFCKENNIDVLIDNCYSICENCIKNGVTAIWYNKENFKCKNSNVINSNSWNEIDNEVKKILNNKKKR